MSAPLHIFYSYAHEDEDLQRRLEMHLTGLKRQGLIDTWHSRNILPGVDPTAEIDAHLNSADIILLLISADFLASDYCYGIEMKRALERHAAGEAMVIPIILRPTNWQETPFALLQALPSDGKPVTSWLNEDEAFVDVVKGIRYYIQGLNQSQTPLQSAPPQTVSVNQTSQSSSSSSVSMPSQNGTASQSAQANVTTQASSYSPATIVSSSNQASQVISKAGAPDAMNAATDKAVRRLPEDQLRFSTWVKALRKFIMSPDTTTPLTIGIDGAWGTGKSSFMYMLQDELEPSSFQDKWQIIKWPWLKWLGLFIATLPIWIAGKLMVYIGKKLWRSGRVGAWFKYIDANLSYDPEIDTDIDQSRCKQFWVRIAAWHCPKEARSNPTVWFNAWKFDQEEQLWAALALAVLDQIKNKYWLGARILFWIGLQFKRLSFWLAVPYIIWKVVLPIGLAILVVKFNLLITLATNANASHSNLPAFDNLLPLSQPLLGLGALIIGIIQISSIIKDPFQIPIKRVFDKPDYKEKIGFIGSFEEDFSRIVSLITRPTLGWKTRKLIIFIDDLDRCKLPKAVDIIEGINLFLDSEQCVFVMGMDTTAVAASIEIKYQDLFKQMREERTGIVSAGRLFLDKIIQVPLRVPPIIETSMNSLVEAITKRSPRLLQSQQISMLPRPSQGKTTPRTAHNGGSAGKVTTQPLRTGPLPAGSVSYTPEEVHQAINLGVSLLPENPRQVKRFINLFRLYIHVANEEHLFEEEDQIGLTMDRLAIWVVLSLRWGELIRHLSEEASLLASEVDLVVLMGRMTKSLEKDGCWQGVPQSLSEYNDVPPKIIKYIQDMQKSEEHVISHWCHLPWNLWFRNRDFLKCVKELADFWEQPRPSKINWLHTMLLMTRVITPANPVPASNGSVQSTNQQNNGNIQSTNQQNNVAMQTIP